MNIEQLVNLKAEAIRQVALFNGLVAGVWFLVFAAIALAAYLYSKSDSYRGDGSVPGIISFLSALFAFMAGIIMCGNCANYLTANARAVDAIANHQMISLGK